MDTVDEKSSCTLRGTITDDANRGLSAENLAVFKATLYLKDAPGTILNSRDAIDLRGVSGDWNGVGGMKATVADGRFSVFLSSADNALHVPTATSEIHVLMVHFETTGSLPEVRNQTIPFEVLNLLKVT